MVAMCDGALTFPWGHAALNGRYRRWWMPSAVQNGLLCLRMGRCACRCGLAQLCMVAACGGASVRWRASHVPA